MVRKIPLTRGKFAIVDDEDYEYLNQWNWSSVNNRKYPYARRHLKIENGKPVHVLMHRIITNCPKNMQVDHINHNTLDNRKANLRICTKSDNQKNRIGRSKVSGYKGISKANSKSNPWRVYISSGYKGKYFFLGNYKSQEMAAKAYNEAAKKYHGEFAYLNVIKGEKS